MLGCEVSIWLAVILSALRQNGCSIFFLDLDIELGEEQESTDQSTKHYISLGVDIKNQHSFESVLSSCWRKRSVANQILPNCIFG